jgi:signal transduction histidine kinase
VTNHGDDGGRVGIRGGARSSRAATAALLGTAALDVGLGTTFVLAAAATPLGAARRLAVAAVPVALLAGALAWLLSWERTANPAPEYVVRVVGWRAGGAAVFGLGAGAEWGLRLAVGSAPAPPAVARGVVGWTAAGVCVGTLAGVLEARGLLRADRNRELVETLSVLNRVLRHDIRNDANVVDGYLGLVEPASESDREYLRTAQSRVRDVVRTGRHAREAERLVRGEGSIDEVDLAAVVDEVAGKVSAEHPGVDVRVEGPPSAYGVAHDLVASAVRNVVENAVVHGADGGESPGGDGDHRADRAAPGDDDGASREASTPGTVRVAVRQSADRVEVVVADDGPGIDDREVAVLDAGAETALEHANGMGLWLTSWVVDRSNGSLAFETGRRPSSHGDGDEDEEGVRSENGDGNEDGGRGEGDALEGTRVRMAFPRR